MGFLELIGLGTTEEGIKVRSWLRLTVAIVLMLVIIALLIWGCVALVKVINKRSQKDTFIPYNPIDTNHKKINITPETSYIESYITSALGLDDPQTGSN